MDLREEVIKGLDKVIAGGVVEKAIETQLKVTIEALVRRQLEAYSDFGKQLEEKVQACLAIHQDEIDLPSYSDTVLKILQRQLESYVNASLAQQLEERMRLLLAPAPESIKLSELVEQYGKFLTESDPEAWEANFAFIREDDEGSTTGFTYIGLDDNGEKQSHRECDISFGVYKGEMFSLRFRGEDVERELFAGPFYDFQRTLFQMRTAGTRIELDVQPGEVDTLYGQLYD